MTWVKLDNGFPEHPKVVQAGPLAAWLFICSLAYASRQLTDGFIPAHHVRRLADIPNPGRYTRKLLEVGLWEEAAGGYQIHDYLNYQSSAVDVQRTRRRRAEAGRSGGQATARANAVAKAQQSAIVDAQAEVEVEVEVEVDPPSSPPPPAAYPALGTVFSEEEISQLWIKFPLVDLQYEANKCIDWWHEKKKQMKRPRTALRNWFEKAQNDAERRSVANGETRDGHQPLGTEGHREALRDLARDREQRDIV